MQTPEGLGGESKGTKGKDRRLESLPPLVSAALEPGTPSLAARLGRIAAHGRGHARYTLLGEVAQGGMGKILRVWDEGLAREVAMKVVPREAKSGSSDEERADHEQRLARFIDEARITGQLDHPGIVPVYEIGLSDGDVAEAGSIFFTMPLVRGRNLKSVFALVQRSEEGWTLQRAVDVMHTVCLTVAFAHSKGVVHRDLKPENIMVGPFGEAYVMDWGLALLLGRTERASIVGTPAYMAPEQAAGMSGAVGPHSDVYSLGAILYELFAGLMPHETSLETRVDESGSFEQVVAVPPRPLRELRADVPPELAAICAKAMAREPSARYASALEMADDLAAWLAGRVVSVLPTGPWERLRKWRMRNRALAFALDSLAALLLVGSAAFFLQQRFLLREVRAKNEEVRASAYASGLSAADLGLRAHETGESRRRLAACDQDLRGWEWRHLALRADSSARVLLGHEDAVRSVAVSPDGTLLASGSGDGTIKLWDAESGALRASLAGHADVIRQVLFAPDGRRLASAGDDNCVRLWNVAGKVVENEIRAHVADVVALAFSLDGAVLASGDGDGDVVLSNVEDGCLLACRSSDVGDGLAGLDFVASTGELAAAYVSGYLRMLDATSLEVRREAQVARKTLAGLDVDPTGTLLAVAFERTAVVLDVATLVAVRSFDEHGNKVSSVAFAPEGARLATTSFDNVLRIWRIGAGRTPPPSISAEFDGHDADVNSVAFLPDGERLVTGAEDDSLRVWDLARAPVTVLAEQTEWIDALSFSPDGTRLVTGGHDQRLRLFEPRSATELRVLETSGIVDCLVWMLDGELAYGCGEPAVRLARLEPCGEDTLPMGEGVPKAVVFDPEGARLFARDSKGRIVVHALASKRILDTLDAGDDQSFTLALSPDGRLLVAGTASGAVLVWDARTLARRPTWVLDKASVSALAFSPDGAHLAVGRQNGSITLLATKNGALEHVLDGHERFVSCLAFSLDGARLVSGSYDHTLRIWNPASAQSLLTLHGHTAPVTAVAFDPSGEILASTSKDRTLRLWRTALAYEALPTSSAEAARSRPLRVR